MKICQKKNGTLKHGWRWGKGGKCVPAKGGKKHAAKGGKKRGGKHLVTFKANGKVVRFYRK
jgi:hypothetical protein